MEEKTKSYASVEEMFEAGQVMQKFQKIHNVIRLDYQELLNITEANIEVQESFHALYRACIRSLFSLMEADIYNLNALDSYDDFDDHDKFINKFKETYKQIAATWGKETVQQKYFSSKMKDLLDLKKLRDQLVHPKEISHIHIATAESFNMVKKVFKGYDNFVNEMMTNFFLSVKIPVNWNE
jgi:hypothetical protein